MGLKRALVVGGGSGIGLSIVCQLINRGYQKIYIVGNREPDYTEISKFCLLFKRDMIDFIFVNFVNMDYSFLFNIAEIDTLFISVGFGRVANFEDLTPSEIRNSIFVNELSVITILRHYYTYINSKDDFYCGVMVSIAGHVASPMFSVYSATKAALRSVIENVNIELIDNGVKNRILDISPGALNGTCFNGQADDLKELEAFSQEALDRIYSREVLFIPQYKEIFSEVINRYKSDPITFGLESLKYKRAKGRPCSVPQCKIGYLSGTFDVFHIGHLNLLKRAKKYCDYLVVGVHESGAWKGKNTIIPFEQRKKIVEGIRYVDKVITSYPEDSDAWSYIHYHYLFVGSDYKGTDRFNRYEEFFSDKDVQIIYFPYTEETSSTSIRKKISSSEAD